MTSSTQQGRDDAEPGPAVERGDHDERIRTTVRTPLPAPRETAPYGARLSPHTTRWPASGLTDRPVQPSRRRASPVARSTSRGASTPRPLTVAGPAQVGRSPGGSNPPASRLPRMSTVRRPGTNGANARTPGRSSQHRSAWAGALIESAQERHFALGARIADVDTGIDPAPPRPSMLHPALSTISHRRISSSLYAWI